MTELVEKRAAAKKAKDWATADAIRAQLTELGWAVKDTAQGPQLSKMCIRDRPCTASMH